MLFRFKSSLAGASLLLAFILLAIASNVIATTSSSLSVLEREVKSFELENLVAEEREEEEEEMESKFDLIKRRTKKGKKHHRKKKHRKNRHKLKNKYRKNDNNKNKKKGGKQRHPSSSDYDGHSALNAVFPNSECSNPKATALRPNGCISFLNCGIHSKGGWNPPPVKLKDLKILSGDEAAQKPVFAPCRKYLSHFKSVAQQSGVPVTVLMSFAMQESSCNKNCLGENGEIGMMQITKENCQELGVNPSNAWDVETNIRLGAKQFKNYLDQNNGNVILSIGMYNGWYKGLTEAKARNKQYGCFAQNNLDYLDSMFNAFLQGKDGYTKDFQTYNNLAECGNSS